MFARSSALGKPAVANAQAVLARFCALKFPMRRSAAVAKITSSFVLAKSVFANGQTVLAFLVC